MTPAIPVFGLMISLSLLVSLPAQEVIPLWPEGAPGFEDRRAESEQAESYWVKNIHNPSITAFLPDPAKVTGAAVLICPGGGHRMLVYKAEGVEAAEYLQSLGIAAFVLKYRLAREEGSPYDLNVHAKQDAQRAIRLIRSRAVEWGIDPTRVGIMGFSAGGEVVSMLAYANDNVAGNSTADDRSIEDFSARPDFQILIYPGPIGIPEEIPTGSPPAFLLVAGDDRGASRVVVDLIPKLRRSGIPLEAHIYARGGHAFNMGGRTQLQSLRSWPDRLRAWMEDNFILDPQGREEYLEELSSRRSGR